MSAGGSPPRWFVWLCAAVVAIGIAITLLGAVRIGVTVDETFHAVRLQNYLSREWYLLDDDLTSSGPGAWVTDRYVYAPVATLLLHTLNVLVGNESWAQVSTTADAYVVRHVGVALLGLATVSATAAMARLVLGSWRWGLTAAAVLVCLPMWTGHAMFNVKDVPVGAGYTLVTLGCMLLLSSARRPRATWPLAAYALVMLGTVLAVGTRPAIWPGIAACLVCTVVASTSRVGVGRGSAPRTLAGLTLAFMGGMAVLAAIYPQLFLFPHEWVLGSASESSGYAGQHFWAYIPGMVALTVPAGLLIIGIVGTLAGAREWFRRRPAPTLTHVLYLLVGLQALLLPTILTFHTAALSGGLRHVLFATPAVAVLITGGVARFATDLDGRRGLTAVWGFAAASLCLPLLAQVQAFPYSYAYSSGISVLAKVDPPLDPWQASFKEYQQLSQTDLFVVCGPSFDQDDRPLRGMPNGGQSGQDRSQDCGAGRLGVLSPYLDARAPVRRVDGDFLALYSLDAVSPVGCDEVGRVSRRQFFRTMTVSRALVCPLVLPAYDGPMTLDGSGEAAPFLLGGWSGVGGDPDMTVEERASLGFHLDALPDPAVLRVDGSADGGVEFLVNNVPASAEAGTDGWLVRVPDSPPELGEPGNLVLTVVAQEGAARVSHVEVEGAVG